MQIVYIRTIITTVLVCMFIVGCGGTGKKKISERSPTLTAQTDVNVTPDARAQYNEAIEVMRNGNIARAKQILTNMTKSFPELSGPYVNLGIIHFRADEIDKAEEYFQQAIKVNPNSAVSLNHLGIIFRGKGKFEEAKEYYVKALETEPNYAYAHLNYGILLDLYLGELDDALNHYERYLALVTGTDDEVEKWIVDLKRRIKRANK